MYRFLIGVATLSLSLQAAACSPATSGSGGTSPERRRSDVIARAELAASDVTTAHDAVRELRPQWLLARGPDLISIGGRVGTQVAVDNVLRGGLAELHSIRVDSVEELRFIGATDATTRYGIGVQGGVIEVTLRRTQREPLHPRR